ncbi:MAG: class III signal peptide-containing protein [Candidatus Omnitrophica bacterium]|nr:class III signal peptide-containing protein [Candidatus Omnitrophota bacterium]
MKNKGQSTVEYVLLVTAVVAVVIVLTVGKGDQSPFQKKLNNTITTTMSGMETEAQKLTTSMTTN